MRASYPPGTTTISQRIRDELLSPCILAVEALLIGDLEGCEGFLAAIESNAQRWLQELEELEA